MDEENKNQINDTELEEVSGGRMIRDLPFKMCPKCKRKNAFMSDKCKYCGAELK